MSLSGTVQRGIAICSITIVLRCFVFTGTIELAWHNNLYRAFNLPPSLTAKEVSVFFRGKHSCLIHNWPIAGAETFTLLSFHELSEKLRRTKRK